MGEPAAFANGGSDGWRRGGRPWIRVGRGLSRARCIRHEQGLRWGWQGGGAGLSQIRRSHPGAQVGQYGRKLWENYIRLCHDKDWDGGPACRRSGCRTRG